MPRFFENFLNRGRGQRGLALVTVLWVLVLLSLIAASFTATTRTEVSRSRQHRAYPGCQCCRA